MRCSNVLLAAGLCAGLLTSGCGKVPSSVVIEGEISPELTISGEVQLSATTDLFLCKRNLFQSPQPKDWYKKGELRLKGTRYSLRFDLKDAPSGGLCGWKFDVVMLDAHLRARPIEDSGLATLTSVQDLPVHLQAEARRLLPGTTLQCDIREGARTRLHCDVTRRAIDINTKDVRLGLHVKYKKGHQWVND